MNKKGILFTITTIFLLLAVFMLSSAYLTRNKDLQRTVVLSLSGNKLKYIEDDVTDDIYEDILGMNIKSITRGTDVKVAFNFSNLTASVNHSLLMENYEDFIEGLYSTRNNLNVTLKEFNNSFSVSPYNSTFILDSDMFYGYTTNPDYITKINITLNLDEPSPNLTQSKPGDSGAIEIAVDITHNGGRHIASANLAPASANDPFYITFTNGTRIDVNFGTYNGNNGVLRINASGLQANTVDIEYTYNLTSEKVAIKGGNLSISSPVGNITKQTQIIIAQE
ncbi:hypothetical protein ACFLYT_01145 [Nanoarchaeota archaeon]